MRLVFDIETNGFLDKMDRIHCIVVQDVETGVITEFCPGEIDEAVRVLTLADELIGHNIMGFDIPAINFDSALKTIQNAAKAASK